MKNKILFGIIMISLLIGAGTLTRGHEWGDDFASYIMQAQSILNGATDEFIKRNTFTIFESSVQPGPVAYPWGYPLVLTPALMLKGVHPLALKLPGFFFFAGFLFCLYLLTEKRLTRTESLLIVSLFAFNPTFINFLDRIVSDIPFLFFVFFALLLIVKFKNRSMSWGNNVLLGAALFFAFFFRTTGIILLAGFLAHQASCCLRNPEGRKTNFVNSLSIALSFGLLWTISSLIFPNGQGSYFEQLKGLTLTVFKENAINYFLLFASFFGSGKAWIYIYYALIVFFLIGTWTRREEDQSIIIFFWLYLFAMFLWPEWQGIRFIFPLLPIFVYLSFQGISTATGKLPENLQPVGKGMSSCFWLTIIGIFLYTSGMNAYSNLRDDRQINGPFDSYSDEVFNFIKTETPPDSVIVFFKPRAMRLFTDRDSIMSIECDRLLLGDYVVLHKNWEYSQILPKDIQNCDLPLRDVYENRRYIVYEVSE